MALASPAAATSRIEFVKAFEAQEAQVSAKTFFGDIPVEIQIVICEHAAILNTTCRPISVGLDLEDSRKYYIN